MARYSAGVKTGTGSTTLPLISLYGGTNGSGRIREIGLFNTTNTAADFKLVRLTSTGTQGTGLAESKHDPDTSAANCTAHGTHSVGPGLGDDLGYRASVGAAIGAGVILTFGDSGLRIARSATPTADGIGLIVENGTGVALQAYIVWDE